MFSGTIFIPVNDSGVKPMQRGATMSLFFLEKIAMCMSFLVY